jgi:hypothetical protein
MEPLTSNVSRYGQEGVTCLSPPSIETLLGESSVASRLQVFGVVIHLFIRWVDLATQQRTQHLARGKKNSVMSKR